MITVTAPAAKKRGKRKSKAAKEISPQEHFEQVKKAYHEMRKVYFDTSKFKTQASYATTAREKMAISVGATRKGVRGTAKPLCDPANVWVAAYYKKRKELYEHYESNTEPQLVQVCDDDGQPMLTADGDPVLKAVRGVRLIKYDKWISFRDTMREKFLALKEAARDMDLHRSSIYETDKGIIGLASFNEADYSSCFADAVQLTNLWHSCETVDVMLPAHERREHLRVMLEKFNEQIATACMRKGTQLEEAFVDLARALSYEQVCHPDQDGPYKQYQDAVLVTYKFRDHSQDEDVPIGKVRVCVRQKVLDPTPGKKRNIGWTTQESYIDTPMSAEEIEANLRPSNGEKRNMLANGLIKNVVDVVNEIRGAFKDLTGPHASAFESHLAHIYKLIDKLGGNADTIESTLKSGENGDASRDEFAIALLEALPKLADQAVEAVEVTRAVRFEEVDL